MKIEFADGRLAAIETDEAARITRLPIAVIRSCRRKLIFLRAAPDERAIRNWKSLHYEKLSGDRKGQRSIRINEKWRIVFELNDTESPPTIVILAIDDYH